MSTVPSSPAAIRLSEEAQDLICAHVITFSNKRAMNTLYSLALTSKAFLESAQHALYKAPLRALAARPTWPRAEALLLTLQTRPGLALHIRQLATLESVAKNLSSLTSALGDSENSGRAHSFAPAGHSSEAACDWALGVVAFAINTESLSSPMTSESHARRWATIIPSLSRVSILRIYARFPFALDFQTFESWTNAWSGREMRKVSLCGVDWPEAATNGSSFRLPFSAQELHILGVHLTAPQLIHCLPRSFNFLESLTISSYDCLGGGPTRRPNASAGLETLFKLVGQHLRTFSFTALHRSEVQSDLESYSLPHYGPTLPLAAFKAFPAATSLILGYLTGMTPAILTEISRASPKLRILNLHWTAWSGLALDGKGKTLLPALNGFSELQKFDMGYLPVYEKERRRMESVQGWADERGVALEWQGCLYPEYSSEDF